MLKYLFLLFALVLWGCAPMVDSYHQPVASEGKLEGGKCTAGRDELGPPSKLQIRRGPVYVIMDGNHLSGGLFQDLHIVSAGSFDLEFQVPAASRASMDWQQLTFLDRTTGTAVPFKRGQLLGTYQRHTRLLPLDNALDPQALVKAQGGEDKDDQSDVAYAYFKLDLHLAKVPDDLELHIPTLTVDGTDYPSIDVEFKHTVGAYCNSVEPVILP